MMQIGFYDLLQEGLLVLLPINAGKNFHLVEAIKTGFIDLVQVTQNQ